MLVLVHEKQGKYTGAACIELNLLLFFTVDYNNVYPWRQLNEQCGSGDVPKQGRNDVIGR